MKKLHYYRYEILLLLLVTALFPILLFNADTAFERFLYVALVFGDAYLIYLTLRKLWLLKWREPLIIGISKIMNKLSRFIINVINKLHPAAIKKNVIIGETKIIFDLEKTDPIAKTAKKRKKWKQLDDPAERLGYLYKHIISDRLKRGERILASNTPSEIDLRIDKDEGEELVFDRYIRHRYDDRTPPSIDDIAKIKDKYYSNLK